MVDVDLWHGWDEYQHERIETDARRWFYWYVWLYGNYRGYRLIRTLNEGLGIMARGKSPGGAKTEKGTQAGWTTFVEISVVGLTQTALDDALPDADTVFGMMAGLIERGYRLGVSYNPQNDAFIASWTCKNDGDANAGCTMTSFAGTWYDAIRVSLYKHFNIARQNWRTAATSVDRPSFG